MVSIKVILICVLIAYTSAQTTEVSTGSTTVKEESNKTVTGLPTKDGTANNTEAIQQSTSTLLPPTTPKYPLGDARNCKGNHTVIPGLVKHGVDSLVYNLTKGQFYNYTFTKCKTTMDKEYLIPDGVFQIDLISNLFNDKDVSVFASPKEYRSLLFPDVSDKFGISGTFSEGYKKVKKEMIKTDAFVVRVGLSKPLSMVDYFSGDLPLASAVHKELYNISNFLVNGNTEMANYLADRFIMNYGTHYPMEVTTGGVLAVEFIVKKALYNLEDSKEVEKVKDIAKAVFNEKYELQDYFLEVSKKDMEVFKKASTNFTLVIGGQWDKNSTREDWEDTLESNPQPINFETNEMHQLVNYHIFPELPPPIIQKLKTAIKEAVLRYYKYNIHSGCTNSTATNYDFGANIDDYSCNVTKTEYIFGGIYQTCNDSSEFSKNLKQKNPLTNDYSCPKDFEEVPLRFKILHKHTKHVTCTWKCTGLFDFHCEKVCTPEDIVEYVEYKAYWCVQLKPSEKNEGVPFGGIFTSKAANPNTGDKTCPENYTPLRLDRDVRVCIGNKNEKNGVIPFGGFYSCSSGNPLVTAGQYWLKRCPKGYNNHMANIDEECYIHYCTSSGDKTKHDFPHLVVPGNRSEPKVEDFGALTLVIIDSFNGRIYYRTGVNDEWKEAKSMNDLKKAGLEGLVNATGFLPPVTEATVTGYTGGSTTGRHTGGESTTGGHTGGGSTTGGHTGYGSTVHDTTETEDSSMGPTNATPVFHEIKDSEGMSSGTIAAITIVTIAAVLAILGVGAYIYKKRTNLSRSESTSNLHGAESGHSRSYDEQPNSS